MKERHDKEDRPMTVAELITKLQAMPPDATPVDQDELEVTRVTYSPSYATVTLWTEQK